MSWKDGVLRYSLAGSWLFLVHLFGMRVLAGTMLAIVAFGPPAVGVWLVTRER